uniref:ARAD1C12782p n=1 Tax=Blastobotrys adeninivorans TaxID=409370 RepID=A0A060T5J1_BLAAD
MSEIHNIVILTPKEGKLDEVVKGFTDLAEKVKANEPGTLVYYLVQPKGANEIIVVEKYADADALKKHGQTDYFKEFFQRMGGLLAKAPEIKTSSFLTGFESKI